MKKSFVFFISALLTVLTSCKKSWLEIVPQGSQVAVTTSDYDKLMNDVGLYVYPYDGGFQEPQLMGDEVAGIEPFFINKNVIRDRLFKWEADVYPTAEVTPSGLSVLLKQMYQLNKVIKEVMGSAGGSQEQKRSIRAEALATRAFTIFNLANYYCKPYLAETAGTDPGFPFITEPNVSITNFPRGTLQQTYDFIIKDFTDALADIPKKQPIVTRMSRPAVEGLLGKVYLFMGKYNAALPLLKASLLDVASNGQTALYDYNQTFAPSGAFLPISATNGPNSPGQFIDDVKEAVVSKVFYSGSYNGNQTGNDGLVLTSQAQELFQPEDLRLNFYTNNNPDNSINPKGWLRKYGVNYSRFGLQLSELYLLSAECKARTNDLQGAVFDLETLRKNRMPAEQVTIGSDIGGNQASLIRFIIDERIREFAMEGYRWFDMRRLSVDPLFSGKAFKHTMFDSDGNPVADYILEQPHRLVLKFPRNIRDTNPDMIDNP